MAFRAQGTQRHFCLQCIWSCMETQRFYPISEGFCFKISSYWFKIIFISFWWALFSSLEHEVVELGKEDPCPGRSSTANVDRELCLSSQGTCPNLLFLFLLFLFVYQMGWSQKGIKTTNKLHSWEKMSLSTFPFPINPKPLLKYFFSFVTCAQHEQQWTANAPGMGSSKKEAFPTWKDLASISQIPSSNQPRQLCTFSHKTLASASSSGTK